MSAPQTIPELFYDAVQRYGTKSAALRYKADGVWHDITHQDLARRVQNTATGLLELGYAPGDRIAILSETRSEWAIADYACLLIGCVDVSIYPSLPAEQVAYLLNDSGSKAVILSNQEQCDKVLAIRDQVPGLQHIIALDPVTTVDGVMSFSELTRSGAAAAKRYPDLRERASNVTPDTLATLIYTSGTTGDPKGVMLTHGNFVSNVAAVLRVISVDSSDSCLSILPLSHGLERTGGHYVMLHAGVTIHYSESADAVADNMAEVRPTVMISVPRLYEKIHARVVEAAMSGGSIKRRIFLWAQRVGAEWTDRRLEAAPISRKLAMQRRLADRLVFSKLRARTGGKLRFFVSGGAPLSADIARFFYSAGIPILEGYGLTETSPIITINPLERIKLGTVGAAVPGVEVSIAEDGEVRARGPNIMAGYYNKPDATAEAIDAAGWFSTGDIGELDTDGYLKITDRKKDIIVTAAGKKIAPQPIEHLVKSSPFILNAVMIGDQRRFALVLVVPDTRAVKRWMAERQLTVPEGNRLLDVPEVVAKIEREAMLGLRGLASFEMPKKVILIEDDFSEERGELTPTQKVRRRAVEEHYRALIDAAYT